MRTSTRAGSSVGRASALQAGGRRFKPCSAHHGGVVQFWLERRPVTPEVASSSLVVPAKYIKGFSILLGPFFIPILNFPTLFPTYGAII